MILVDEEDPTAKETPKEIDPSNFVSTEVNLEIEVLLNLVAGLSPPKTMKVRGAIGKQPVVTLIEPGVTYNFIASHLVSTMGIPIKDTESYGVRMGTCDNERGSRSSTPSQSKTPKILYH